MVHDTYIHNYVGFINSHAARATRLMHGRVRNHDDDRVARRPRHPIVSFSRHPRGGTNQGVRGVACSGTELATSILRESCLRLSLDKARQISLDRRTLDGVDTGFEGEENGFGEFDAYVCMYTRDFRSIAYSHNPTHEYLHKPLPRVIPTVKIYHSRKEVDRFTGCFYLLPRKD